MGKTPFFCDPSIQPSYCDLDRQPDCSDTEGGTNPNLADLNIYPLMDNVGGDTSGNTPSEIRNWIINKVRAHNLWPDDNISFQVEYSGHSGDLPSVGNNLLGIQFREDFKPKSGILIIFKGVAILYMHFEEAIYRNPLEASAAGWYFGYPRIRSYTFDKRGFGTAALEELLQRL